MTCSSDDHGDAVKEIIDMLENKLSTSSNIGESTMLAPYPVQDTRNFNQIQIVPEKISAVRGVNKISR